MLVLRRKPTETICIGDSITLTIVEIQGNRVRVGIEAPRQYKILRGELGVRPDRAPVSALESQPETPLRSEPDTVSRAAQPPRIACSDLLRLAAPLWP
jgi:carbon storage regulator CsrA